MNREQRQNIMIGILTVLYEVTQASTENRVWPGALYSPMRDQITRKEFNGILARLAQSDYIDWTIMPNDDNQEVVRLTPKGLNLARQAYHLLPESERHQCTLPAWPPDPPAKDAITTSTP